MKKSSEHIAVSFPAYTITFFFVVFYIHLD